MNNQDKEAFERWWNEEGSGMPPKPGEETEHFARRMTEIAWTNGAYAARERVMHDEEIEEQAFREAMGLPRPPKPALRQWFMYDGSKSWREAFTPITEGETP